MGGVIVTPTRGMGEPMYRLPQTHCRPMRLGSLFSSRRFCTEDFGWTNAENSTKLIIQTYHNATPAN